MLQGTDSGAVPVLHMESWPPGGACFGTTELHFVDTPSSESKVSCAEDAFQARCSTFWQPPTC